MSSSMKLLKIYYKGTCQEFSVADGTPCDEIYDTLKRLFRIKEPTSEFFFHDEEGRIVILPKNLPSELSLYLYVRSESVDTQPKQSLKWTFICTEGTENQLVDGVRYSPINSPNSSKHPSIISSVNFSTGKHFTVIKLDSHGCGWVGLGLPGSPPEYFNPGWHCSCEYDILPPSKLPTFIRLGESECDQLTKLTGIVLDCDSKVGYFVQVNEQNFTPIKIILKVTDLPSAVLIFAGAKGWDCIPEPHTGITLVKDSLPFPDLSKLQPQKTVSWITAQEHKV